MRRFAAPIAVAIALPLCAQAAEITRVASSFEDGKPFGMFIDATFVRTQLQMAIRREEHLGLPPPDDKLSYEPQLRYFRQDYTLALDGHFGLWHDVEFHYGVPLVIRQFEEWKLSSLTNDTASSVINNCVNADGSLTDPACSPSSPTGAVPVFPISEAAPAKVTRWGLGNMHFGFSWAPFNQNRDDTKPMWLVGIEYVAPTADQLDPTDPADDTQPGAIGDRVHQYQLWSAFSKRMGLVDPYVRVEWSIPVRGPGFYSNCDNAASSGPDPRLGTPQNCHTANWSRAETGIRPPQTAEIITGAEFLIYNQPEKKQRFILDARARATYVGEGRYYNELSGVLKKLMFTGDYVQVAGRLNFNALVAEYLTVKASVELTYDTDHNLSSESVVKDPSKQGEYFANLVTGGAQAPNPDDVNPNFDYRVDLVGRRFRATAVFGFNFNLMMTFAF